MIRKLIKFITKLNKTSVKNCNCFFSSPMEFEISYFIVTAYELWQLLVKTCFILNYYDTNRFFDRKKNVKEINIYFKPIITSCTTAII